ncbi:MAG: DUF2207 family protein [Actinomycetota bacterium]
MQAARRRTWGCLAAVVATIPFILLLAFSDEIIERFGIDELSRQYRVPLLTAAGALTALWLGVMAGIRVARQPRAPHPGPATGDLRSEPPAIVNMLANDFDPSREALPATVLDLAARGALEFQEVAGDTFLCRLREARDLELAPFEARVMDLVRSRAHAGVVPAEALTTGPADHARAWWRKFRGEVIDDAQRRGLSRDLWSGGALRWVGFLSFYPAAFLLLATAEAGPAIIYLFLAAFVIAAARGGRRQRETPAGLAATAEWLGVQRYLRDATSLAEMPPTAVPVWERHLAYGAALGVAPAAVRAIPMGPEEARRAWSSYGGQWRRVRIRYPVFWPPAWGFRPVVAVLAGVVSVFVAAGTLRLATAIGWPPAGPNDPAGLVIVFRVLFLIPAAAGVTVGVWGVLALVRGAMDLGAPHRVTGQVLRLRETGGRSSDAPTRFHAAIDDGRSYVIRAWSVRSEVYRAANLKQYEEITAEVSPNLRFVGSIRRA